MKKSIKPSDIIEVNGEDYFVAEINTKGTREILELDLVKPSLESVENPLHVSFEYERKNGTMKSNISYPSVSFCPVKSKWKCEQCCLMN